MADDVHIEGEAGLRKAFRTLSGALQRQALERATMAGLLPITNEAKRLARKKSGSLARSIHPEIVTRRSDLVEGTTGTDLEYAAAHEFGSGLHATAPGATREKYRIAPKNKKVLAWLSPVASDVATKAPLYQGAKSGRLVKTRSRGKLTFAREVWHPGVKPGPYMRPAYDTKKDEAIREVTESLRILVFEAVRQR